MDVLSHVAFYFSIRNRLTPSLTQWQDENEAPSGLNRMQRLHTKFTLLLAGSWVCTKPVANIARLSMECSALGAPQIPDARHFDKNGLGRMASILSPISRLGLELHRPHRLDCVSVFIRLMRTQYTDCSSWTPRLTARLNRRLPGLTCLPSFKRPPRIKDFLELKSLHNIFAILIPPAALPPASFQSILNINLFSDTR